jgi:hypothetical protein
MVTLSELLAHNKLDEAWDMFCGFLDLDIREFMAVQRKLLEEQLAIYPQCELGRHIFREARPRTLEQFREQVPFTTYKDYAPYLLAKNEDALPEKPRAWVHTSGMSSEYDFKWVPFPQRMYESAGVSTGTLFVLSAAKERGDFVMRDGMSFPYIAAPPPYLTGVGLEYLMTLVHLKTYPPIERALKMDFMERMQEAFSEAMGEGIDFFCGISSILLRISEGFNSKEKGGISLAKLPRNPKALLRLVRAFIKAKAQGRNIMPKDIWKLKGAMCGGMDTSIFKDKVTESWGVVPLEIYAASEFGAISIQSWTRTGLTFFPHTNFWEFISEADYHKVMADPRYIPHSFLMDEVQQDTEYVLVGSNFYGGALCRYIIGDLVKFVASEDAKAGIKLPQMVFVSRIDGILDIGGFTRLTEKTIWQAIVDSGVHYADWTVRKELVNGKPVLRLYIELKNSESPTEVEEKVHNSLKRLNVPYSELEELIGLRPLAVSILTKGTYKRYFEERQASGSDIAHLKPPHVNASEKVMEDLLRMSRWKL